jgi:pimeloyl-ACP methyl ester carboxylesterase
VLAIQGTEDAYGSLAQVEVIKRSVSAPVDTLILSACGHSPHLEARAVVMDRVANFLATNLRH